MRFDMNPDENTLNQKDPDQKTDASLSRRAVAKKVAYIAPAILAVISIAERPALAQSGGGGTPT
jgi:hypothetical protein